ncbi:arginine--tRNA ligase [Paenibacillus soyae]|uniref:Arginine--tRNA ligase n=1 Tax=Paenibacillus soyae TaxID=2969249 RepID=A0A9X2MN89_9BACL|nr:arginine--tRNA ligase [Paenibacillus soyae]MCR2803859.1 arginine--tRNA ligase [Paenibacillus soyae]
MNNLLLAESLAPLLPIPKEEIAAMLEYPPNDALGDVALPCFVLARTMKQSPAVIAQQLAERLSHPGFRAEAAGPYLNFKLNRPSFAEELLLGAVTEDGFWRPNAGEGKRVVIDMSSPNVAKPFGIGHLRSTMIGNAISRILGETGHETVNVNHLGDWGTQFGKMITAYLKWGSPDVMASSDNVTKEYLALYVKFHEEAEKRPELEDEAREWFRKLESGDAQATKLWQEMIGESLKQFNKLYARLGVTFDHVLGESFYNDKMGAVIESLREQGLLEESEGALVVRLDEEGMPPCLLVKSDGTSIYATRDLATAIYRREQMDADILLYVVGGEQALHFQQVFRVLEKLDASWQGRCRHIPFGLMMMEGQKMSTRRGKVLFLEDVLNEAVSRAREVIEAKNPTLADKEAVAEAVGIGAVVFGDLKNTRTLDVDFSLKEVLNFDGETGPYLQYTYARTCSILRKAGAAIGQAEGAAPAYFELADNEYVWPLLKLISHYPTRLQQAAARYEPSILARYLLELAQAFNRFYHHVKVLDGGAAEQVFKLSLVRAASEAIRKGLSLLGIRALEEL